MVELLIGITLWNVWLAVGGFLCDISERRESK
jgi:hypothetical protein